MDTKENRLERLEFQIEEQELTLRQLEDTIKDIDDLNTINLSTEVRREFLDFIKQLEKTIEHNEFILEELNDSKRKIETSKITKGRYVKK